MKISKKKLINIIKEEIGHVLTMESSSDERIPPESLPYLTPEEWNAEPAAKWLANWVKYSFQKSYKEIVRRILAMEDDIETLKSEIEESSPAVAPTAPQVKTTK
tara:strand:+ start:7969 stop:8280 length:312 start_codon:yes stop_codon:yes gene_type:complete